MVRAYHYTLFYYHPYFYYDPYYFNLLNQSDALATRKIAGVNVSAYYPFNLYYRAVASLSYNNYSEEFYDPFVAPVRGPYQQFLNGNFLSASFSIVGETTRFKNPYGPISGNTFALSLTQGIPVSSAFLQSTNIEADYRQYLALGSDTLLAFRLSAFASRGKNPFVFYYGGNNQVRSADFYSIVATEGWYSNLEFRFPLVNAAFTLIGQIGPIRGTFFFDITRAKIKGYEAKFVLFDASNPANPWVVLDAIGSYGYGLEFFFLGLPMHIEFAKRLEWQDISKPFSVDSRGKYRTVFWIGFDF